MPHAPIDKQFGVEEDRQLATAKRKIRLEIARCGVTTMSSDHTQGLCSLQVR